MTCQTMTAFISPKHELNNFVIDSKVFAFARVHRIKQEIVALTT
jgi:hypothetical protein